MHFRISGIDPAPFQHLFAMSDDALAAVRAKRYIADSKPGFPCRVSLEEAEPGEALILTPYSPQMVPTPYQSSGPIFVRECAKERFEAVNVVPEQLATRLLSLRAYDNAGMMVDAEVVDGLELEKHIDRLLGNDETSYIHVHFARRGCYAARIARA
ncbi:MAG: DUF1203 domain-containing protein [Alphaproteobacteria bacterium]|nr:DUF1203 domain-containing protein [Alphaproteobacteria bacterium]